jgi:hypothetical protein
MIVYRATAFRTASPSSDSTVFQRLVKILPWFHLRALRCPAQEDRSPSLIVITTWPSAYFLTDTLPDGERSLLTSFSCLLFPILVLIRFFMEFLLCESGHVTPAARKRCRGFLFAATRLTTKTAHAIARSFSAYRCGTLISARKSPRDISRLQTQTYAVVTQPDEETGTVSTPAASIIAPTFRVTT